MAPLKISVIVPVLNEEAEIGGCVRALRSLSGDLEILVADGGSADRTLAEALEAGADRLIRSAAGRGTQMRAGAMAATGGALLFLHADARLPPDAAAQVEQTLAQPRWSGGAFRMRYRTGGMGWFPRLCLVLSEQRSRITRIPYGDQAVFTRRSMYEAVGGMPEQPLMEDIEFARRLRRAGPIRRVPAAVTASGRRFQAHPFRCFLCWNTFPTLYRAGVSAQRLARWYGWGRPRRDDTLRVPP